MLKLMISSVAIIIPLENSTIENEPPVYHFGPPNNRTFYVNVSNKPIVYHSRPSEVVWHEIFQQSNWAQSFRGRKNNSPFKFVLNHKQLSGIDFYQNLQYGQMTSQLSCFDEFDKHKLVNNVHRQRHINKTYSILPLSFVLPFQTELFKNFSQKHPDVWMIDKLASGTLGNHISILKPSEVNLNTSKIRVVQEYLTETALYKNHKFDLRVYLLITSVDPLIAYVHREGYAKIAAKNYSAPNEENKGDNAIHLTNFAQSKKYFKSLSPQNDSNNDSTSQNLTDNSQSLPNNANISSNISQTNSDSQADSQPNQHVKIQKQQSECEVEDQISSFITFSDLIDELFLTKSQFSDHKFSQAENVSEFQKIFDKKLRNLFQKLLVASHPQMLKTEKETNLLHEYPRRSYARYGADVMLLRNGEMKLIEVNRRPQQHTQCDAQKKVAPQVILDELNLVGIPFLEDGGKVRNPTMKYLKNGEDLEFSGNLVNKMENGSKLEENQFIASQNVKIERKKVVYTESFTKEQMKQNVNRKFEELSPFEQRALRQITDEKSRIGGYIRIWPNNHRKYVEDLQDDTYLSWLTHQFIKGNIK